jgi:hypothetical protein
LIYVYEPVKYTYFNMRSKYRFNGRTCSGGHAVVIFLLRCRLDCTRSVFRLARVLLGGGGGGGSCDGS